MRLGPNDLAAHNASIYPVILPNTEFSKLIGCVRYEPPGPSFFGFSENQLVH